jgi:F0F1-type ATP synthase delta subunit
MVLKIAPPYDDEMVQHISEYFSKFIGREPEFNVIEDPSIIGGFVAILGDRIFDASVSGQLNNMGTFLKEDKSKTDKVDK